MGAHSAHRLLLAAAAFLATSTLPADAAAGDLDLAFGLGGKVTTPIDNRPDFFNGLPGMAMQGDGKIVVAGSSWDGSNYDLAIVRYTATGVLDTSFGTGGKVTTPVGSNSDYGQSVAVQSDGNPMGGFRPTTRATNPMSDEGRRHHACLERFHAAIKARLRQYEFHALIRCLFSYWG